MADTAAIIAGLEADFLAEFDRVVGPPRPPIDHSWGRVRVDQSSGSTAAPRLVERVVDHEARHFLPA